MIYWLLLDGILSSIVIIVRTIIIVKMKQCNRKCKYKKKGSYYQNHYIKDDETDSV